MSGVLYLLSAIILGGVFLYYAINLFRGRDDGLPLRTFIFSIYYLMALFTALLLDHYLLLW
jgi:protoheme IX farnesyltransferase